MTISAKMTINPYSQDDNTDELSRLVDYLNLDRGITFTEGEGANQVDMIFHDQRTLADGANETLDFHNGSLTNKVGVSITMDKLKAMYIKNGSADASLKIGAAATNQIALFGDVSDLIVLPPGGEIVFIAPDASGVDISTNAKLKFEHNGTGVSSLTYDLIVMGVDVA